MLNVNEMVNAELLKALTRAVERAIGRTSATADIVSDAVESILAKAETFDSERGNFRSWAMRIASNEARNWKRARANNGHDNVARTGKESADSGERKTRTLIDSVGAEPAEMGHVVGPDGRLDADRTADAQALAMALATLDDQERAFIFAINDGKTQTEAGALVGWSPATATRKRKAIAAKVAEYL